MITESKIKAAIRAAASGTKTRIELHDSGARGAGRLVLVVRGNGKNIDPSAEFYARWYRSGKRGMSKLGSYPAIPLRDARKRFLEEFAPASASAPSPPARPLGAGIAKRPEPLVSCSPPTSPACGPRASGRPISSRASWTRPPRRSAPSGRRPRSSPAIPLGICPRFTIADLRFKRRPFVRT
jgi:hypothetical protein